jgi:hypothetical protein
MMIRKARDTGKTLPRVAVKGKRERRIDPKILDDELGADFVGLAKRKGSPLALSAARLEIRERLKSTGGRPKLVGTTRRQKIPLDDGDWAKLVEIAQAIRDSDNVSVSPGQVAGALLHLKLSE